MEYIHRWEDHIWSLFQSQPETLQLLITAAAFVAPLLVLFYRKASHASIVAIRLALKPVRTSFRRLQSKKAQLTRLEENVEFISSQRASASSIIQVGDLIQHDNLLVHFTLKNKEGHVATLDTITSDISERDRDPYLILGDRGRGKSTLMRVLFVKLANEYSSKASRKYPIFIDLSSFQDDAAVGNHDWISSHPELAKRVPQTGGAAPLAPIRPLDTIILIDSLDEYFSGKPVREMHELLSRPLFQIASIISCRTNFHARYFQHEALLDAKNALEVQAWNRRNLQSYVKAYVGTYAPERSEILSTVARIIDLETFSHDFLINPVQINLLLDVLREQPSAGNQLFFVVDIYEHFLKFVVFQEAKRQLSWLDPSDHIALLEELAYYSLADLSEAGSNIVLDEKIIEKQLRNRFRSIKEGDLHHARVDILQRGLLRVENVFSGSEIKVVKFAHKSFQDFLVARLLWQSSLQCSHDASSYFRKFISYEVAQFFKDYLAKTNKDQYLVDRFSAAFVEMFTQETSKWVAGGKKNDRYRLSRQQIAYFMGHIEADKTERFLTETVLQNAEEDEMMLRGAAIGLACSGIVKHLDQYVDRLRRETSYQERILNSKSVSFSLNYFGDQTPEGMDFERDAECRRCYNTVAKLIQQLATNKNPGKARYNLYTVVYIGMYRPDLKDDFYRALREFEQTFRQVLTRLGSKPPSCDWPEVNEAWQLLTSERVDVRNFISLEQARPVEKH